MCFGFLGSNTTHEVGVGYFPIFGDVGFWNGVHGTGAGDALIDGAR